MINEHHYTIENINVSSVNIDEIEEKGIQQTITKLADGPKKGETEIEVFKEFALKLEEAFGAEISTFSPPTEDFKHWRLHLPKDGNFNATPSRFSVSFYIIHLDSPELIQ